MNNNIYKDGKYLEKHPTWHIEHSPAKTKQILKMIEKNQLSPASICEIGCGAGEILKLLYQMMPENVVFSGYEISPQAFDLCKTKKNERLNFFLKDITQVDLKNIYDMLLVFDVFEHIEDYLGFLRKIKEKGTYKIFRIPLDLNANAVRTNSFLKSRYAWGHLHCFTKDSAIESLKATGYEIVDYFYDVTENNFKGFSIKKRIVNVIWSLIFRYNQDLAVRLLGGAFLIVLAK